MDRSTLASANQFNTLLLLVYHQVRNYTKNQESNFSKRNKSVLSHITFYLEYIDRKLVNFNNKTLSYMPTN